MPYPDGLDRATELAHQAFSRMSGMQLPPHPDNFTLWYMYYSGELPDLVRTVDFMTRDGLPFTAKRCDELFRRFFSVDSETQAIREAGERTQRLLSKVVDLLQGLGKDSGHYGRTLDDFKSELEEPLTVDQLRALVTAVAAETKVVAEQHQRLQGHISDTSTQLAELRASLQTARREALTDSLTGIGNRKAFDFALNEAVAAAIPENQPLSLMMIDIDHFKKFNDAHGHLVGDHVLRLVARVLTECIKGRDSAARYGGEEFAIVLPMTTLANATALAEQVRKTVGSRKIVNRNRNESFGNITLSIGVAEYVRGEPLNELIQRADTGLYTAKRTGRNRVAAQVRTTPEAHAG
ncbi:MAG: diguanylate cyclase [Azospirillum sp.]|nr:diguanylate cyclase [Azospirillum sp.]